MPERRKVLPVGRRYTAAEADEISRGVVPQEMEDKWFVYRDGDDVFFHRSWTGVCVYVAHLVRDADGWLLRDATVNRHEPEYGATDDRADVELLVELIDVLLLHCPPVPLYTDEPDGAVRQWGVMGRAMLGTAGDEERLDAAIRSGPKRGTKA